MALISALIRRTAIQRFVVSRPSSLQCRQCATITQDENTETSSVRRRRPPKLLKGTIIEEKFERFPKPQNKQLKAPLPVIDLTEDEAVEDPISNSASAEKEDTQPDGNGEVELSEALKDYKVSEFDAQFIDRIGPGVGPAYNVAAIVDKVEVLQKLVEMGVSLYKLDYEPRQVEKIIALNWEEDCEPRIALLTKCGGLHSEDLGPLITKNPLVLCEEMQHLEARLDYLTTEISETEIGGGWGLDIESVRRVITMQPFWLSTSIERIENRIEFFRENFALTKEQLKHVMVKCPKVILSDLHKINLMKIVLMEECGFSFEEMKNIMLISPRILIRSRPRLVQRFDILHCEMGFSQEDLSKAPQVLHCREKLLQQRLGFLRYLNRAQFDKKLPNYVSPLDIAMTNREEFIEEVAKSTVEEFEIYLKTH